jgi:hypothetical protein
MSFRARASTFLISGRKFGNNSETCDYKLILLSSVLFMLTAVYTANNFQRHLFLFYYVCISICSLVFKLTGNRLILTTIRQSNSIEKRRVNRLLGTSYNRVVVPTFVEES